MADPTPVPPVPITDEEIPGLVCTLEILSATQGFGPRIAARIRQDAERIKHLSRGWAVQNEEIQQTLGKALGYPYIGVKDGAVVDPKTEGASVLDEVCVGDHVAETLVMEAAERIKALEGQIELREAESSSAVEAYGHLNSVLQWNAGGLGAAALEVKMMVSALQGENASLRAEVERLKGEKA